MSDAPTGIHNPGVIDDITTDADGVVRLHVVQTGEWDSSDHLLLLLQEKLFNYLAFVADGELARRHPGQRTRWGVVLDCTAEPDERTLVLLREAGRQFESMGGSFDVKLRPD